MFGDISLPFGVGDMINTSIEFIKIHQDFILLVIACIFAYIFITPLVHMILRASGKFDIVYQDNWRYEKPDYKDNTAERGHFFGDQASGKGK